MGADPFDDLKVGEVFELPDQPDQRGGRLVQVAAIIASDHVHLKFPNGGVASWTPAGMRAAGMKLRVGKIGMSFPGGGNADRNPPAKPTWKVGQKYKGPRTGYTYDVVAVTDSTITLEWVTTYAGATKTVRQQEFELMLLDSARFELIADVRAHDFSDRYCSGKKGPGGDLILFCLACGVGQGVNDDKSCVPNYNWRAGVERYIAQMVFDDDCNRQPEPPELFPERKKRRPWLFRQCNPLQAGGVFSTFDENARKPRFLDSVFRPWDF